MPLYTATQQFMDTTLTRAASTTARKSLRSRLLPYLLIAPTLLGVFVFTLLPATRTLIDSTFKPARAARDPSEFVALANYVDLFDSTHYIGSRFTQVLGNTFIFSVLSVGLSVPLGLGFAVLLNRRIRGLGLWRFSLFYPALLPVIGAASIWAFLYSSTVGLINSVLRSFGGTGLDWIGNPNLVLFSVISVDIWKQAGYFMIFFLAGLQGIPRDIYEAAELDGANEQQQFWSLTLPLLRRTILFVLVIAFTFSFQTVEQLQVLGQGQPGDRGNLLLYFIFQNIGERRNWGYTNAMSVILAGILLLFTISNFIFFERGRDEDGR
jgi:sn-glycerol 3-phosphate transport system permease protein